jgi:hypothetical protein
LIINLDVQEIATEVDFVVGRKADGDLRRSVFRAIHLGSADFPSIPQSNYSTNPPRSEPSNQSYNGRLPEGDVCLSRRRVGKTKLRDGVYNLFSETVEDSTNTKGKANVESVPNKCNDRNNDIAEGKSELADDNIVRNLEVRSLTLENKRGTGVTATNNGRPDKRTKCGDDVGGLMRQNDCIVPLDRIQVNERLSHEENCRLLESIAKYQDHFVTNPGEIENRIEEQRAGEANDELSRERMKQKIQKRRGKRKRGNYKWKPVMNEKVLVRTHHNSDAVAGVTGKFIRPFEGPYVVSRLIPPSTVEVRDDEGKFKGNFNWKSIKAYVESTSQT